MRLSKEIVVLLVLLAGMMGFVLWYVADRKAKNRAEAAPVSVVTPAPAPVDASAAHGPLAPSPVAQPAAVNLAVHDQKTIDFSSGRPVVKDSAEDQAAMDAALKDMAAATDTVKFGPTPKKTEVPTSSPKP